MLPVVPLAAWFAAAPPGREVPPLVHRPTGPLAGLVVHLSAGHGYLVHRTARGEEISWDWQRDASFGLREDVWTADFVIDDLAPALEAAGATVLTLRERDRAPVGAVVDDLDPGFHAVGDVRTDVDRSSWGPTARTLGAGASVTWTFPPLPPGTYRVEGRWVAGAERPVDAAWTVRSRTGAHRWHSDQRKHGGMWWPLGEIRVGPGDRAAVTLSGTGASADAVRIGGGTAAPGGDHEPRPAWEVATVYRYPTLGGPPELPWLPSGEASSDIRLRARWASWASAEDGEAVYLSIHTNAGRESGTRVFVGIESEPPLPSAPTSVRLAEALVSAVTEAARARVPTWTVEGPKPGDFSEISPKWQHLPSVLLEVGYHDNPVDVAHLQDPVFRAAVARGIVEGLGAWRAARAPGPDDRLPAPPEALSAGGPEE